MVRVAIPFAKYVDSALLLAVAPIFLRVGVSEDCLKQQHTSSLEILPIFGFGISIDRRVESGRHMLTKEVLGLAFASLLGGIWALGVTSSFYIFLVSSVSALFQINMCSLSLRCGSLSKNSCCCPNSTLPPTQIS